MENLQAKAFEVGEKVTFESYLIKSVITEYGETNLISFADKNDVIIRKVFDNGSLTKFLAANPEIKTLVLKKKLKDGAFTHNLWAIA